MHKIFITCLLSGCSWYVFGSCSMSPYS